MNGASSDRCPRDTESGIYARPRGQGQCLARRNSAATEFDIRGKGNIYCGERA